MSLGIAGDLMRIELKPSVTVDDFLWLDVVENNFGAQSPKV